MRRRTIQATTLGVALALASPATASPHGWDKASTIGLDTLIGVALLVPAVQGDWKGDLQTGGSMAAAELASIGLKEAFPEERPDHSDRKSFPSGHASVSFAAAVSLEKRYGWEVGIPALAVASFVSAARVEARKHHWYDVAAGAAIGSASGFLITSPRNGNVRFVPWADSGGGGIALAARF
jgi:membrane-associated phospholipid phosphatase